MDLRECSLHPTVPDSDHGGRSGSRLAVVLVNAQGSGVL
jgi:hypothetical protein